MEPGVQPLRARGPLGLHRSHPQEADCVRSPLLKSGFRWVSALLATAVLSTSLAAGSGLGNTDAVILTETDSPSL